MALHGAAARGGQARLPEDNRFLSPVFPEKPQESGSVIHAFHIAGDDPGFLVGEKIFQEITGRHIASVPVADHFAEPDTQAFGNLAEVGT